MSTAVATINHGASVTSYRDKIDTIKQTVARNATDAQLEMFLTLADKYQLDPFLKEIWFVPNVGIVTGRDGYLKVALRDPNYDGIVSAAVCEGDTFEINPVEPTVKHSFGTKRGQIIGAYAIAFHKGRRPAVCFAPYAEYAKGGNIWNTYKSAMICKVAEVLALKRQFGISGLITEEEIGVVQPDISGNVGAPSTHIIIDVPSKPAQSAAPQNDSGLSKADLHALTSKAATVTLFDSLLAIVGADEYKSVFAEISEGASNWSDLKSMSQRQQAVAALRAKVAEIEALPESNGVAA